MHMKKILLTLAAAVCAAFGSQAQIPVKYHGELNFGYSIGVGDYGYGRINIQTIQGVSITDFFSAGIGTGLDIRPEDDGDLFIPLFLNMKGYLPLRRPVTPFVSLDLGYEFGVTDRVKDLGGFMWMPAAGIRYKNLMCQVGFLCHHINVGLGGPIWKSSNAVQIKVGVAF